MESSGDSSWSLVDPHGIMRTSMRMSVEKNPVGEGLKVLLNPAMHSNGPLPKVCIFGKGLDQMSSWGHN